MNPHEYNSITEVTRRNIFDVLTVENVRWYGRMDEPAFLARIFDLKNMPSTDHRFNNAASDIRQHCVHNFDWPNEWIFTDSRFNLLRCADDEFLPFLCEMLHPIVQADEEMVKWLLDLFNGYLVNDGWEIAAVGEISDRPIFAGRRLLEGAGPGVNHAKHTATILDAAYISKQIGRMEQAIVDDPELAIGTAKEFVESICKTILDGCEITVEKTDALPRLLKKVMNVLALTPHGLPRVAKTSNVLRRLLSNLGAVGQGLAELRNLGGSGHGRHAATKSLEVRHARLAVGASTTLGVFLFETYQAQIRDDG